jgi:lycopene cyclase domain-containing protein
VSPNIKISHLLIFVASITVLGSLWDIWAARHGKQDAVWLWQFNFHETIGIKVFDLPIEEYLFYICSSVYVVFLWEGIKFGQATESMLMLLLLAFAGVWSALAIGVPYLLRSKGDRVLDKKIH